MAFYQSLIRVIEGFIEDLLGTALLGSGVPFSNPKNEQKACFWGVLPCQLFIAGGSGSAPLEWAARSRKLERTGTRQSWCVIPPAKAGFSWWSC